MGSKVFLCTLACLSLVCVALGAAKGKIGDRSGELNESAEAERLQTQEITQLKETLNTLLARFEELRTKVDGHMEKYSRHTHDTHQNELCQQQQSESENEYFPISGQHQIPSSHEDTHQHRDSHQHSHSQTSSDCSRSKSSYHHAKAFMNPPVVRNPEDYDFAVCHMRPNSALTSDQIGNVHGIIFLTQKKNSKNLQVLSRLAGFNMNLSIHDQSADLHSQQGLQEEDDTQQVVQQVERLSQTTIKGDVIGSQRSISAHGDHSQHSHGIHVHEKADLSQGCDSTGAHYNPYRMRHGGPRSSIRHIGDFGNIECDDDGNSHYYFSDEIASLRGTYSIVGKPLVIHALKDDLGTKIGDPGSTSTGNSGPRIACCIIESVSSGLVNNAGWTKTSEKVTSSSQEHSHSAAHHHHSSSHSHTSSSHSSGHGYDGNRQEEVSQQRQH